MHYQFPCLYLTEYVLLTTYHHTTSAPAITQSRDGIACHPPFHDCTPWKIGKSWSTCLTSTVILAIMGPSRSALGRERVLIPLSVVKNKDSRPLYSCPLYSSLYSSWLLSERRGDYGVIKTEES